LGRGFVPTIADGIPDHNDHALEDPAWDEGYEGKKKGEPDDVVQGCGKVAGSCEEFRENADRPKLAALPVALNQKPWDREKNEPDKQPESTIGFESLEEHQLTQVRPPSACGQIERL
jgi:hypothetical protein